MSHKKIPLSKPYQSQVPYVAYALWAPVPQKAELAQIAKYGPSN
jgi:hypothetical protein